MPNGSSVLDASALLAFVHGEPGMNRVASALQQGAIISAVNWAEVLSKLVERGISAADVEGALRTHSILGIGLRIIQFDEAQASLVAELRGSTRAAGLSLGDRACLALGQTSGAPVLTADRSWASLHVGVQIETLR